MQLLSGGSKGLRTRNMGVCAQDVWLDVMNYRRDVAGGGLKRASMNRKPEALRRVSRWAHRKGKLVANPAMEVKLARTVRDLQSSRVQEPGGHGQQSELRQDHGRRFAEILSIRGEI